MESVFIQNPIKIEKPIQIEEPVSRSLSSESRCLSSRTRGSLSLRSLLIKSLVNLSRSFLRIKRYIAIEEKPDEPIKIEGTVTDKGTATREEGMGDNEVVVKVGASMMNDEGTKLLLGAGVSSWCTFNVSSPI